MDERADLEKLNAKLLALLEQLESSRRQAEEFRARIDRAFAALGLNASCTGDATERPAAMLPALVPGGSPAGESLSETYITYAGRSNRHEPEWRITIRVPFKKRVTGDQGIVGDRDDREGREE